MRRKTWLALCAAALGSLNQGARADEPAPASPAPVVRGAAKGISFAPATVANPATTASVQPAAAPVATAVRLAAAQPAEPPPVVIPGPAAPLAVAPTVDLAPAPAPNSGVMGGASIYFLRPYISNNTAFVTNSGIGTPHPSIDTTNFDYSFRTGFATWLGYTTDSGFGVRARFFWFDQSATPLNTSLTAAPAATTAISGPAGLSPVVGLPPTGFGAPGVLLAGGLGADLLAFSNSLRIETLDFEGTYAWQLNAFSLLFSGGGRYLQMAQNYNATLTNNVPAAGSSEFDTLSSGRNFYGGGPTAAIQGNWRLGNSGLSFFGLARGSIVVGTGSQDVAFNQVIVSAVPGIGVQNNLASNHSPAQQVVPIAELELGLQYGAAMGRSMLFIRGAAVSQTYFNAGSASTANSNLSLFGGQVSLGLNY